MPDDDQEAQVEQTLPPVAPEPEPNVVWTDHLILFQASLSNTRFSRHTPTINRINSLVADIRRAIEECPGH